MRLCGIHQLLDMALEGYNVTVLAVSVDFFSFFMLFYYVSYTYPRQKYYNLFDELIRRGFLKNLAAITYSRNSLWDLQYGQTGSGKTFTLSGADEDPSSFLSFWGSSAGGEEITEIAPYGDGDADGIIPRSLAFIFRQIESRNAAASGFNAVPGPTQGSAEVGDAASITPPLPASPSSSNGDGCRYSVRLSYCEIYNEALYDLLHFDERQLALKWDPVRGFHAPELHVQECPTLAEARAAVARGVRHRRVGSHNLNLESSRSHAILTVYIDATPLRPEAPDYGTTRRGKVVFVDLAGSERLEDSQSVGEAMRETASINRSLFMLGKVISALAAGARGALVPYRESKLTKLLMDSLGGSALSLMIACCSPR